ncbi:hypothetical protein J4464_04575 [Candidatus Woesearchaeota archaeon]|nr:hypothetical protein [Candidatus Woesearchaeota archaeon]
MAYSLYEFFSTLQDYGIIEIALPFILVFAIMFAILEKTKIFGQDRKNISIVVSLVLAFIFVYFGPLETINKFLPSVSALAIAIIMLLILLGLFGWESRAPMGQLAVVVFVFALIAVIYLFGAAADWWSGWNDLTSYFGSDAISLIIILLVFGLVIAWVTASGTKEKKGFKLVNDISNFLSGK